MSDLLPLLAACRPTSRNNVDYHQFHSRITLVDLAVGSNIYLLKSSDKVGDVNNCFTSSTEYVDLFCLNWLTFLETTHIFKISIQGIVLYFSWSCVCMCVLLPIHCVVGLFPFEQRVKQGYGDFCPHRWLARCQQRLRLARYVWIRAVNFFRIFPDFRIF